VRKYHVLRVSPSSLTLLLVHPSRLNGDLFVPAKGAASGHVTRAHPTRERSHHLGHQWSEDNGRVSASPPPYTAPVGQPLPVSLREHQHASSRGAATNLPAGSRHTRNYSVPPASQNHARGPSGSSNSSHRRQPTRRNTAENVLGTLRKFNTVFLVDDSGSMQGARWKEVGSMHPSRFLFDRLLRPEMRSHHWRRLRQNMTQTASTSTF
jgi:hypothetical protein